MKFIFMWLDRVMRLDEVVATAAVFALFLVAISNIFMRYVFSAPLAWTEEILQLLLVWATFLGASALVRRKEHVFISFVTDKLPPRLAHWNEQVFSVAIILASAIAMLYWGTQLLSFSAFRSTPMLQIPYYWIHVAIPVSAVVMIYHCMVRLVQRR
ncbi:TRAP transporter small permease [Vreelandella olivaria]|uniref:TRAP transporter small permease n=1 Tax=Vreelandella olivaria TaxID=390919 RepID=UPI00201E894C|nr:TRAP transporter small permease [Halomonas olivaria]